MFLYIHRIVPDGSLVLEGYPVRARRDCCCLRDSGMPCVNEYSCTVILENATARPRPTPPHSLRGREWVTTTWKVVTHSLRNIDANLNGCT
jgi:hypothetical protein